MEIRFARSDDARLAGMAPEHWRRKADGKRFEKDRRLELVAGGLLADMLSPLIPKSQSPFPVVSVSPSGKPFLPAVPDVHFSLSHSEEVVMCVVADRPVGCDVEKVVPLEDEMKRAVGSIANWTLREAAFKCGEGADAPRHVPAPDGYSAAVAERSVV